MKNFRDHHFNNLRKLIGLVGIGLPIILLAYTLPKADCNTVLNSISAYFHSKGGHIFSAFALLIGVIMWNTVKYPEDKWIYRLAAALAIIIGFFPNLQKEELGGCIIRQNNSELINYIHLGSAITFFLVLSYLVYFRFTKSDKPEIEIEKQRRNRIFRRSGIAMLATMVLIFIYWFFQPAGWEKFRPVFTGEAVLLCIFSLAWFIKGQFWIKDKNNEKASHL